MENIINTIIEHKASLNRVLKHNVNCNSSTITFAHAPWWQKTTPIVLWIVMCIEIVLVVAILAMMNSADTVDLSTAITCETVLLTFIVICIILIRQFTYQKIVNIKEGTFEFKGQFRKKWTFTLDDYICAETRHTIKDFPEEFHVKFQTENGIKSFKFADLNKGYARNIIPNHLAVTTLWDTIINEMQLYRNQTSN